MTRPGIEPSSPGPLANTLTAGPIYIYIYIYIYIVIHRQTVSSYHNILMWQHTWNASSWDQSIIRLRSRVKWNNPGNEVEHLPILVIAIEKRAFWLSSTKVTNFIYIYIYIYIYIVIHRQTVSLYHNSLMWLCTRDASSWDWNLTGFTSVGYLTPELWSFST